MTGSTRLGSFPNRLRKLFLRLSRMGPKFNAVAISGNQRESICRAILWGRHSFLTVLSVREVYPHCGHYLGKTGGLQQLDQGYGHIQEAGHGIGPQSIQDGSRLFLAWPVW